MAKTVESLFYWLTFVSDFLVIVLFLFFLCRTRKYNSVWIIPIYTLINLSINASLELLPLKNVFYIYTSFTFIEYFSFTAFIYSFIKSTVFKKVILFSSAAFTLFLPVYFTYFEQAVSIDSIPIGLETLFILFFCSYYFYEQMNDLENHYIYNRYHFWIIIGILLYLAGSFFIYIFANHVDKQTRSQFWFLTYFFYVVKNLFFLIGLMNYNKSAKSLSRKNLYPYLN